MSYRSMIGPAQGTKQAPDKNPIIQHRRKHIHTRYHFIREGIVREGIQAQPCED